MKLVHIETKKIEDRQLERYEIGKYIVRTATYPSGYKHTEVQKAVREDYVADIYGRTDIEGNLLGFEVQTTSYGSLPVDELRKVIAGLEEAAQVVEILTTEFVK